jgi:D-alanyl-D-alanine carboxypeptidase
MPQFIARMNAKAKQLGMKNTHFVEPTGLSEKNVSTARDIAILVEAANKIPRISAIGKKNSYTLTSIAKKPKTHTIKTTNKLLLAGENVSLGKTGFIDESRYNFTVVGQSPAGGSRTVVVLNAPSSETSFKLAKAYLHLEK